eukprot:GHVL01020529.1.p1 GENE.GHVL01020529.1~~GHVL01020529.1.p1  ORF type:complete len:179 (-),score=20.74 GHVL01020529.1:1044-1580(-)
MASGGCRTRSKTAAESRSLESPPTVICVTSSSSSSTAIGPRTRRSSRKPEKTPENTLKRPIENISHESFTCIICMNDECTEKAILNKCRHQYCFDCIYKWSQTENTCPQCKATFTKLDRVAIIGELKCDPSDKKRRISRGKDPRYTLTYSVRNKSQSKPPGVFIPPTIPNYNELRVLK